MSFICLGVFAILLIVSFALNRTIKHPTVLFNILWLVVIFVSIIGFEGIKKPSSNIYTIFLVGGICFNIGSLGEKMFAGNGKIRIQYNDYHVELNEWCTDIQKKVITILEIILLVYYIIKMISLLGYISGGLTYDAIRSFYYSDSYFTSQFEYLIVNYIFDPAILITEILFGINLFCKQFNLAISIIMFLNILLRAVISGGRIFLLEFVIVILLCYFVLYKKDQKNNGKKIGIIAILLSVTIVAVAITTGRGRSGSFFEKIWEMLVVNFTGSFTYLDVLDTTNQYIQPTYGLSSFAGLIDPFISIMRFFGLTDIVTKQVEIGGITSNFVLIGSYSYNAMPTMYYYFITDFPTIGIYLFPFLLGFTSNKIYRKLVNGRSNTRNIFFYMFLALVIIKSPMNWPLFQSSFILAVPWTMLLFHNPNGISISQKIKRVRQ